MSLDFEFIPQMSLRAAGDTMTPKNINFSRVPRRLLYNTHIYTHIYARYAREFQNMVSHVSLCHLYMNSLGTAEIMGTGL